MNVRRFLVLLVAVCAAASGATVALASSQQGSAGDPAPVPLPTAELQALADDVAVLRDPAMTDGQASAADLDHLPVAPNDPVLDVADARGLVAHPGLVLAPTSDGTGVCVAGDGRMTCGAAASVADTGAAPAVLWNVDGVSLLGVTSDDVPHVTVVYAGGATETVAAVDNVLEAELRARPVEVHWTGPAGPEHLTVTAEPTGGN